MAGHDSFVVQRDIDFEMDIPVGESKDEYFDDSEFSPQKILFNDLICTAIMKFLSPTSALNLLSVCKESYHSENLWEVLTFWMGLRQFQKPADHPRNIVIFAAKKLGYNCSECYQPLDGPNGFFACSSLCLHCANDCFKNTNSGFVDSSIRFYLVGNDSFVTRGRAFVVHPYWVSIDDNYKIPVSKYGSAFQLAVKIYDEKMFFQKFAPPDISRPRDDKPATLRRMICDYQRNTGIEQCPGSASNFNPDWARELPDTLVPIYEQQKSFYFAGLEEPPPLDTMPLRELVQGMHTRDGITLKYLN